MRTITIFAFFLAFLLPVCSDSAENEEESFYSQLSHAIIRLEHIEHIQQEGSSKVISRNVADGTGFFVITEKSLFVVSARHVVEKPHDLHARVQCRNKKTGAIEIILLKLPRHKWVFHENNGDENTHYVDVAAMKLPWINDRFVRAFRYEPEASKDFDKNQLPYEDPEPPKAILVFGFPGDIGFQLLEQRPLGRLGIISMKTEREFIKLNATKFAEERCCLLDVPMFPGNSGSPVINQMNILDPQPRLLGLVIATNTNMNYAIMEPVSRIREVLDLAKDQSLEGLEHYWSPIKEAK